METEHPPDVTPLRIGQIPADHFRHVVNVAARHGETQGVFEEQPGFFADAKSEIAISDFESALADHLYAGYLSSQENTLRRLNQHDNLNIPSSFSFRNVNSLSHEMIERLERARPSSFGQAREVPGITPAALANLLVQLTIAQSSTQA